MSSSADGRSILMLVGTPSRPRISGVYSAVLLDVYGTLVHDNGALVAEVASLVADLAGADRDAVAREWSARASGRWPIPRMAMASAASPT